MSLPHWRLNGSFTDADKCADEFTPRGRIVVNTKELVSQEAVILTDDLVSRFRDAANDTSQLYFVKAVTSTGSASSFTRTCAVVQSSFSCILNVYLDVKGQFIGIGVTASNPTCSSPPADAGRKKASLSTSVNVIQTALGPQPDTQSYIQRMEQEKLEKMRGDRGDNRSFLAKYVSYSPIPVSAAVLTLLSVDSGFTSCRWSSS